jgi:hypothetical protein
MCAKLTGSDSNAAQPQLPHKGLNEGFRLLRVSCIGKRRASPLPCISIKRELRHNKHSPIHIRQGSIHFAVNIVKYAQFSDFVGQPHRLSLAISVRNANQNDEPPSNFAHNATVNSNGGKGHPLQ